MLITLAIILNAHVGTRQRVAPPLARLSPAGRAAAADAQPASCSASPRPIRRGPTPIPVPRRWIDWYASAIWRAMGCPAGRSTAKARGVASPRRSPTMKSRRRSVYHERNAEQIELLDRRLAQIGTMLFGIDAAGVGRDPRRARRSARLRQHLQQLVHAGFGGLSRRSARRCSESASRPISAATRCARKRPPTRSGEIERELRREVSLSRAADLTEQAARFMLSDLDEWRLVNQQRDLSVG